MSGVGARGQRRAPGSSGPALQASPRLSAPCRPSDVSGYSSLLREALVPLVADRKCSSPEVYGADISPNMLCAGYFDCRSDACQVSQDSRPGSSEPKGANLQRRPGAQAEGPPPGRWHPQDGRSLLLEARGPGVGSLLTGGRD